MVMVSLQEGPDEWPQGRSLIIPQLGGAPSVEAQMPADEAEQARCGGRSCPAEMTAPAAPPGGTQGEGGRA